MSGPTAKRRLPALPRRLAFTEPRHSFGTVLGAIVIAVIFQMAAPDTDATRLVSIVIQGAVIVIALRAAGAQRHVLAAAAGTMGVLAVVSALVLLGPGEINGAEPRILTLILILLTPVAVVAGVARELREDGTVTIETVFCGICLYLLLGMAFATLFAAIEDIGGDAFFNAGIPGSPNDFLYFSLATLTTTGYGDFSAATELGRAMAVTEALIGQMYLVTVLAVIVSNMTRARGRRRA